MNISLEKIYEELKEVRTYLIKIGPNRRVGNILTVKLNEAIVIYSEYSSWLEIFTENLRKGKIKSEDVPFYENYRKNFELLYKDILNLCQHKNIDTKSQYSNMDTFELKTSLTLLPVMSDDETSLA